MKKLFPDEKGTKKGVREFLDKRGFYIVLLLCIAVVAATAIFVTSRNAISGQPDYEARNLTSDKGNAAANSAVNEAVNTAANAQPEDTQASAAAQKQTDIGNPATMNESGNNSAVQPKDDTAKATTTKENTTPEKKSTPKSTTPKSSASVKQQSFIMPVIGEISVGFAKDKLVYSKTLETWCAHKGVDIASDRGTPVKAAADGVVSDVRTDPYLGITIVVDHSNGLQTLYRNLASDETVTFNQKVKQGEIIGSIGNTATDESAEPAHLHFEVLKNDVSADPVKYLPKSTANAD